MRAFIDQIVDTRGALDIVFAYAGVARGRPPLLAEGWLDDMSMTDYNALIDVNLHGVVYTVQAAARCDGQPGDEQLEQHQQGVPA